MSLVLSLFPGIGLLDMAFEAEGFCVVRGPDLLWGGDIRRFHPPSDHFDGVIGGPPCKAFSRGAARARKGEQRLAEDLIPEFERVVALSRPRWWIAENVPESPIPYVADYWASSDVYENRTFGGVQRRSRRITFGAARFGAGARFMAALYGARVPPPEELIPTVTSNATLYAGNRKSKSSRTRGYLARAIRAQDLPVDFELPHMTVAGAIHCVAQGVPLTMGRAVARAVRVALGLATEAA